MFSGFAFPPQPVRHGKLCDCEFDLPFETPKSLLTCFRSVSQDVMPPYGFIHVRRLRSFLSLRAFFPDLSLVDFKRIRNPQHSGLLLQPNSLTESNPPSETKFAKQPLESTPPRTLPTLPPPPNLSSTTTTSNESPPEEIPTSSTPLLPPPPSPNPNQPRPLLPSKFPRNPTRRRRRETTFSSEEKQRTPQMRTRPQRSSRRRSTNDKPVESFTLRRRETEGKGNFLRRRTKGRFIRTRLIPRMGRIWF